MCDKYGKIYFWVSGKLGLFFKSSDGEYVLIECCF